MASYGPVNSKSHKDDEDGLVDEWGVRYEGHHKPGGGTFYSNKQKRSRRRFMYMAGGAIILLVLIVIIIVAVQKNSTPPQVHPKPQFHADKWTNNSNNGLTMYPRPNDGTILIQYDLSDSGPGGYNQYTQNLEQQLHDYVLANQPHSIKCTPTNAPPDKVCVFEMAVFMRECIKDNQFGYSGGTPCVLLKLNLPRNDTTSPFPKDSDEAKKLGDRYDANYIGVTCDGETEEDRKHVAKNPAEFENRIEYYPKQGFPAFWFRGRTTDKFLPPVVMVKFNTLTTATYIRIKCTAWGKNFNNGKPENSPLYSTSFIIYQK